MFQSIMANLFANYQNIHKIIDETETEGAIWLGDYTAALDTKGLKERNIKTVVTTASGLDIKYSPGDQITHKQYNLLDIETQNILQFFQHTYKDIDEGIKRGSVLIHCAAGISRSSTCLIAYIMKKNNMPFKEALNLVRNKRKIVCPNQGFENQLKQFEKQLNIKNSEFVKKKQPIKELNEQKVKNNRLSLLQKLRNKNQEEQETLNLEIQGKKTLQINQSKENNNNLEQTGAGPQIVTYHPKNNLYLSQKHKNQFTASNLLQVNHFRTRIQPNKFAFYKK